MQNIRFGVLYENLGGPWWLTYLSFWLHLGSWSQGPGVQPCISECCIAINSFVDFMLLFFKFYTRIKVNLHIKIAIIQYSIFAFTFTREQHTFIWPCV